MVLLLDNYDSFTFNLRDYIEQCGEKVKVVRNDEITVDEIATLDIKAIVLSPGPGTPENSGICLDVIRKFQGDIPILGVCLGHQAIGQCFGAKLVQADRPMHGMVSTIEVKEHPMFEHMPSHFEVCRYHSLIIEIENQSELDVVATTDDGTIMAIAHKKMLLWGVQFHPEAILTEHGLTLLSNWLNVINLQRREDRYGDLN